MPRAAEAEQIERRLAAYGRQQMAEFGHLPVLDRTEPADQAAWAAWRAWRVRHGLGTALIDKLPRFTVPSHMPPEGERWGLGGAAKPGYASRFTGEPG
jgi:hypothetical protein